MFSTNGSRNGRFPPDRVSPSSHLRPRLPPIHIQNRLPWTTSTTSRTLCLAIYPQPSVLKGRRVLVEASPTSPEDAPEGLSIPNLSLADATGSGQAPHTVPLTIICGFLGAGKSTLVRCVPSSPSIFTVFRLWLRGRGASDPRSTVGHLSQQKIPGEGNTQELTVQLCLRLVWTQADPDGAAWVPDSSHHERVRGHCRKDSSLCSFTG